MDRKPAPSSRGNAPVAGGALLALSLIIGTVTGMLKGQPSLGFIGGLGVGAALLLIVALIDRARR